LITAAIVAYVLCFLVSLACAVLLTRSWRRGRSRLVMWTAAAFAVLTVSNALLIIDVFVNADLSLLRAALIALGLGLLVYGIGIEEQQ
jgi:hypothetical protein